MRSGTKRKSSGAKLEERVPKEHRIDFTLDLLPSRRPKAPSIDDIPDFELSPAASPEEQNFHAAAAVLEKRAPIMPSPGSIIASLESENLGFRISGLSMDAESASASPLKPLSKDLWKS